MHRLLLTLLSFMYATSAFAQTDMSTAFGMRESVEDISLSPDGTKVAIVSPHLTAGSKLEIADLTAPGKSPQVILRGDGKPSRLQKCNWASNSRLICTIIAVVPVDTEIGYISRIVAVDADGSNMKVLGLDRGSGASLGYGLFGGQVIDWNPGKEGSVLMIRQYVPETTTGTRLAQTKSGIGVDLVDTSTLQRNIREVASDTASEYITDGVGHVRIVGRVGKSDEGYERPEVRYYYRKKGSQEWEPLSVYVSRGTGFNPYAVDAEKDVAYGLMRLDGRLAAYSMALDGSNKLTKLFSHNQVDIDDFVRVGRNQRVVGVAYTTDKPQVEYFDPDVAKLAGALGRAIPNLPLIRFVDFNQDSSKILLWAGSDNDPGRYFLFDRPAKKLSEILLDRPQLENVVLATVKPISFKATDGTTIPGYLTLPPGGAVTNLPAIVMPHGGPGARDTWGFDWLSQYFASQGFAVLQPNFRGSTGYGEAFFEKNGFQSWKTAIGDVIDGGRWLASEGIANPSKMAIFGWSYGGYAALQSAVVAPNFFKAVVAVAPVTDLEQLKEERRGWGDYALVSRFIGSGPHIAEGSPARRASEIGAPVLLFHGKLDRNVRSSQSVTMNARLQSAGKKSELVVYPDLDHYLEDSLVRAEMLKKSSEFIKAAIGQ